MDPEPVARALLVAGVTYLTVGLVTLALGVVFVVTSAATSAAVWIAAVVSGCCAAVWGSALAWLSCAGRWSRPASLGCLSLFTAACALAVASQVALLVLASFHTVDKEEEWHEISIFFVASSGIQLITLALVSLVLIRIVDQVSDNQLDLGGWENQQPPQIRALFGRRRQPGAVHDNYGFVDDGPMWCGGGINGSTSVLSRWPAIDQLDTAKASPDTSYVASEHHPKFIGPSTDDSTSESSVHHYSRGGEGPSEHPVVVANGHPTRPAEKKQPSSPPRRPPRSCDDDRKPPRGKPPVPTPRKAVSRTTPERPPSTTTRRLFLYDPVQLEIPSTRHEMELRSMLASMPSRGLASSRAFYGPWTSDRIVWEENGLPPVPPPQWPPAVQPPRGHYFGDNVYRYDHAIPRTRGRVRPASGPRRHGPPSVFTVDGWAGGRAAKASSSGPRKVTFLEADV